MIYDTAGDFGDPAEKGRYTKGLRRFCEKWIEERADTEVLPGLTSQYGVEREEDHSTLSYRFHRTRPVLAAKPGKKITQLDYARAGDRDP